MTTKSNHKVLVVRIHEVEKHPNADSLGIVRVGGYQVVVKLGDFQPGDLAIYIQPDSVVPERREFEFLWAGVESPVPEKKRRVTVRRFRKEWSEGLLMKFDELVHGDKCGDELSEKISRTLSSVINNRRSIEGVDIASYLGIYHYEPPEEPENTRGDNERGPGRRKFWPRSLKGWLYFLPKLLTFGLYDPNGNHGGFNAAGPGRPEYDVEAYKNFRGAFTQETAVSPGEQVVVTEKIHGSNARYTFEGGKMYAGSRKLWKSPNSNCIWRKALDQHSWIEQWCRVHEGYTLYGEVVPTQKGYDYGTQSGETKFFVFDVLSPEGEWLGQEELYGASEADSISLKTPALDWVPTLYIGEFDEEKIKKFVDGPSAVVGANHPREGVVIRPIVGREPHIRGLGRLQLKIVSNQPFRIQIYPIDYFYNDPYGRNDVFDNYHPWND